MQKIRHIWQAVGEGFIKNFKSATATFLLIMLVIAGYYIIFGPENVVLGLIVAPLMLILQGRDMTAHPLKHFFKQALVLCAIAAAACFSMMISAPLAFFIHLTVAFLLLYSYTCDYGEHLYFQYILGYLFLIYLGPISLEQLPMRLLGMVVGAAGLILYQWFKVKDGIITVTRDTLVSLLDDAQNQIHFLLGEGEKSSDRTALDGALKRFGKAIEHRQRGILCLSEASMATIESVQTLEKLDLMLRSASAVEQPELLRALLYWLNHIRAYVLQEEEDIPDIQQDALGSQSPDRERLYQWLRHLRLVLLAMRHPEKRMHFSKTEASPWTRLFIGLNYSPVRAAYALRVACLLAASMLAVEYFQLPYGRWMIFTIASVSLPYADEIGQKAKNRLLATLIGGAAGLIIFPLIPSGMGRMIAMMSCGYLSCYMPDYLRNFSCATFGALGGAVMMTAGGFAPVSSVVLVRLAYIVVGIVIAVLFNCFFFPMDRKKATQHLARKYIRVTQAVSDSYQNRHTDLQLRYHLVLRMRRLEDKIRQNAKSLQWDGVHSFLWHHRKNVWHASEPSESKEEKK